MVKIKQKKTLNLSQLIEWGFNNPKEVESKIYLTKEHDKYSPYVQFSVDGYGVRTSQSINNKDTFTVEVEEEITEDTFLDNLVEFADFGCGEKSFFAKGSTIKESDNFSSKAFYILNDDLTLTLIWKEGRLID